MHRKRNRTEGTSPWRKEKGKGCRAGGELVPGKGTARAPGGVGGG